MMKHGGDGESSADTEESFIQGLVSRIWRLAKSQVVRASPTISRHVQIPSNVVQGRRPVTNVSPRSMRNECRTGTVVSVSRICHWSEYLAHERVASTRSTDRVYMRLVRRYLLKYIHYALAQNHAVSADSQQSRRAFGACEDERTDPAIHFIRTHAFPGNFANAATITSCRRQQFQDWILRDFMRGKDKP
jgi:hypothetical protein